MSNKPIFTGQIAGFPEISTDYFLGPKSYVYFLSHCHTDHIKGLDSAELKYHLAQNTECRIYCTTITKSLVLRRTGLDYLASHFHPLSLDEQYTLHVSPDTTINVTLLDAFHCPGSAMFLFNRPGDVVLYTGDFRFLGNEEYYRASLTGHKITSLYLDTTFFSPRTPAFREFPIRALSEEVAVDFVRKMRSEEPGVEVHVDVTPGWENIFLAIADKFDVDIQTTAEIYSEYSEIENILFVLTRAKSWVHVNKTNTKCELCTSNAIRLRPSIQWKLHNNMLDGGKMIANKSDDGNLFYITHSMHSSYTECKEFIKLAGAGRVHPIALPSGMSDRQLLGVLRQYWQEDEVKAGRDFVETGGARDLVKTDTHRTDEVAPPLQSVDQEEEEGNLSEVSEESSDCPPVLVPIPLPRVEGLKRDLVAGILDTESADVQCNVGSDSDSEIAQPRSRKVVMVVSDSDSDDWNFMLQSKSRDLPRRRRKRRACDSPVLLCDRLSDGVIPDLSPPNPSPPNPTSPPVHKPSDSLIELKSEREDSPPLFHLSPEGSGGGGGQEEIFDKILATFFDFD